MALEVGRVTPVERPRAHSRSVEIETQSRVQLKDITSLVQKFVAESGIKSGVCHLFVPHTTAGVLIQENDDPALEKDIHRLLNQLAPQDREYHHNDGNCDAHLKAALIGGSKALLVEDGRLVLGRWQGIFFCEFDGPRRRDLRIKIVMD